MGVDSEIANTPCRNASKNRKNKWFFYGMIPSTAANLSQP